MFEHLFLVKRIIQFSWIKIFIKGFFPSVLDSFTAWRLAGGGLVCLAGRWAVCHGGIVADAKHNLRNRTPYTIPQRGWINAFPLLCIAVWESVKKFIS